jgi:uncharacterized alpha-E superfamily protein
MLSRVADSLYWMSRYLERAEHTARLVNVNLYLTLDRTPIDAARHWGRLLASLRMPPPSYDSQSAAVDATGTLLDLANRDSIAACISGARENARQVREQISSEMWEQINRLFLSVRRDRPDPGWTARTHEFLVSVIEGIHLFQGITNATMAHAEGWHFIELGRYIERASETAALLAVHYRDFPVDASQPTELGEYVEWVGLLRSCCAFEAYCRQYTADLRADRLAEFLMLSAHFPRSIRYAARHIQASLQAIAQSTGRGSGRPQRLAGRLLASLDYAQVDEIMNDNLIGYLESIVRQSNQIGAAVHQQYVAYPVDQALSA